MWVGMLIGGKARNTETGVLWETWGRAIDGIQAAGLDRLAGADYSDWSRPRE